MMLKLILASLVLTVLSSPSRANEPNAAIIKIEIPCGTLESVGDVLKKHGELPALTATGVRQIGEQFITVPVVLFINPKTKSWTLVESIRDNFYCVPALGHEMTPYIPGNSL